MPEIAVGSNSNYAAQEKEALIKKEIARVKKIYRNIEVDKFKTIESLIQEAAFMSITLQDLRQTINRDGTRSAYQNGENQWGTKTSVEYDQYVKTIDKYMKIIRQLTDLLPNKEQELESDGFDVFLQKK